jgi:hypothetical protein
MNRNPVVMAEIHGQMSKSASLNGVSATVLGDLRKIVGIYT